MFIKSWEKLENWIGREIKAQKCMTHFLLCVGASTVKVIGSSEKLDLVFNLRISL